MQFGSPGPPSEIGLMLSNSPRKGQNRNSIHHGDTEARRKREDESGDISILSPCLRASMVEFFPNRSRGNEHVKAALFSSSKEVHDRRDHRHENDREHHNLKMFLEERPAAETPA